VITEPRFVRIAPGRAKKIRSDARQVGVVLLVGGLLILPLMVVATRSLLVTPRPGDGTLIIGAAAAGGLSLFCLVVSAAGMIGFRSCVSGEYLDLAGARGARRFLLVSWVAATTCSVIAGVLAVAASSTLYVAVLAIPSVLSGVMCLIGRAVYRP
jgi:hypothetical protein